MKEEVQCPLCFGVRHGASVCPACSGKGYVSLMVRKVLEKEMSEGRQEIVGRNAKLKEGQS